MPLLRIGAATVSVLTATVSVLTAFLHFVINDGLLLDFLGADGCRRFADKPGLEGGFNKAIAVSGTDINSFAAASGNVLRASAFSLGKERG